jgi:hypothetical protein
MDKQFLNLIFIVAICFVAYLLFRNIDIREGLENPTDNKTTSASGSTANGVAGNAESYAANVKAATIKNQDMLLITKYRKDYENAILNVDDLINTLMLQTTLSVDTSNPMPSLEKLNQLNSARGALNSVMKFVDSSK